MYRIFISYPYHSNPKRNKEAITDIFLRLVKFGVMPISPLHMFSPLNDNDPEQRELGLKFCEEIIPTCHAVFFFDEWTKSEGCQKEYAAAKAQHIPVYVILGWRGGKPIFDEDMPEWWGKKEEISPDKPQEPHCNDCALKRGCPKWGEVCRDYEEEDQ